MQQAELFDPRESTRRKDEGMKTAAENRSELLDLARQIARWIAERKPSRTVTADDVQEWLIAKGYRPRELGNAAGSIFRGDEWRPAGFVASRRTSNHGRVIRKWRLEE